MNNMKHHMALHLENMENHHNSDSIEQKPNLLKTPQISDFLLRLGLANNNIKKEQDEEYDLQEQEELEEQDELEEQEEMLEMEEEPDMGDKEGRERQTVGQINNLFRPVHF